MCLMAYSNNKGADQPAHPRSLSSTFVVRSLDGMICILALSKVSRFYLVSVAEQAGLNLTWSKISEGTFSRDVAQIVVVQVTSTLATVIVSFITTLIHVFESAHEIMVLITSATRVVSAEPLLFAHMKYGSRWRVRPKSRHLAPLDGRVWTFEECVYGGRKVP